MFARALVIAPLLLATGTVLADGKAVAGTDGTATSYDEGGKVLLVEPCDKGEDGAWDYAFCVRELREKTVALLCKKGPGAFKWSFQVGSEKSKLSQSTTCK
jgi:hypothetical protein